MDNMAQFMWLIIIYITSLERFTWHEWNLLCFIMVWILEIYPYPSGLLHWHWSNHMPPVPVKQLWRNGSVYCLNPRVTKKSQENCEHIVWDILRQNSVCWDLLCELINLQWNRPQEPLGSVSLGNQWISERPNSRKDIIIWWSEVSGKLSMHSYGNQPRMKFLGNHPCIHMEINHVWYTCNYHLLLLKRIIWKLKVAHMVYSSGLFYQHGLTLSPAWISNYMPGKVWSEIIHS